MNRHRTILAGLLVVLALRGSARAKSGETWFDVNLTSWHSEDEYIWKNQLHKYNDKNFGLGISHEFTDWFSAKAGWFENSYKKTSAYVLGLAEWELLRRRQFTLAPGLAVGLVSGYKNTPEQTGEVTPWGLLALTAGFKDRYKLTLGYLPSTLVKVGTVDLLTLQISLKL